MQSLVAAIDSISAWQDTSIVALAKDPNQGGWFELVELIGKGLTVAESLAALIIIAATLWWFIRQRKREPKVNLEIACEHIVLEEEVRLVHLAMKVSNAGMVLLKLNRIRLELYRMELKREQVNAVTQGQDIVSESGTEMKWPLIQTRTFDTLEIEPGESDTVRADFVIPAAISQVQLYGYVPNPKKVDLGWKDTAIITLKKEACNA